MLSQRGQESAPFELLIAVIVMTFVIVIGFNALSVLEEKTCEGKLNANMEEIKSAIEAVVRNKSKSNVSFELPECYSEEESRLRIIERDELAYCSSVCGGSLAQCTVLQFASPNATTITKCLRISSATIFPDDAGTCDVSALEPSGDYSIVEWKGSDSRIEAGHYTLIRQSNLFSSAPVVCVYRKA